MPKILALDNLSEQGIAAFEAAPGYEVTVMPPQTPEELAAIIGPYDGLVVRSGTTVTAEALETAENLKVIGRAGVGTDNIDKDAATKRGIVVMNVPGGNTISTCEHTFALLFALCRNIPPAHQSMMEGRWDRKKFMGVEVKDKVLGIIGVGRIGGEVVKRAQSFGMHVLAFDPVLTTMKAESLGVDLVELDELVARADFISIHAPKNPHTDNMLRAEHFKQMKPTCRIINCARGGIVNEKDLAEALRAGTIAGAALDVFTKEPLEDNPFLGLENVVTTPHLAASTDEAQVVVAVEVAHQMIDYINTGSIVNAVNVPSIDGDLRKRLQPMLDLGERLGRFLSLYMEGRPTDLKVEYLGETSMTDTYPVTASILTGFLTPMVESPNIISAPHLLEERGISFSEGRSSHPSVYAFEIRVTLSTEERAFEVSGTLFSQTDPRIVSLDGMRMDAVPRGDMVVCLNEDKPFVLARVCTVISEAGVNIGNAVLARHESGTRASTILNIDTAIAEDTLNKIREVPHVTETHLISMGN